MEIPSSSESIAFVYASHLIMDHTFAMLTYFVIKVFYCKLTFHALNLNSKENINRADRQSVLLLARLHGLSKASCTVEGCQFPND